MKNNNAKAIIQILALTLILWIGEFIISAIRHPMDAIFYGFPLRYYIWGADIISGTESKGEFLVANLLIDILFWLAIASILIIARNKLIRQK